MLSDATDEDAPLLGRLMLAANEIARAEKLDAGYRVLGKFEELGTCFVVINFNNLDSLAIVILICCAYFEI